MSLPPRPPVPATINLGGRPPSRTGMDDATSRTFAYWIARGIKPEDAAKRAGLANPKRALASMRRPEFEKELRDAIKNHLVGDIAPRAILTLTGIMDDAAVSPRVRVDAARTLLDRSGIVAAPTDASPFEKGLHELTREQLEAKALEYMNSMTLASGAPATIDGEVIDVEGEVEGEQTDGKDLIGEIATRVEDLL